MPVAAKVVVFVGRPKNKVKVEEPPVDVDVDVEEVEMDLDDMSIRELREYAEENDIDLGKAKKKADILAIVSEAIED